MRKFKELRQTILEHGVGSGGGYDIAGYARARVGPQDSDHGMDHNQNLAQLHPAQIDRINTFLGALASAVAAVEIVQLIVVPLALPPDDTFSTPPLATVALLVTVPSTFAVPPLDTVK